MFSGFISHKGPCRYGAALFMFFVLASVSRAETPRIASIAFQGDMPFTAERAREMLAVRRLDPLEPDAAQAAAETLRREARKRYYPLARVDWQAIPDERDHLMNLVFRFDLGPRGQLRELRFTGTREPLSERQLKKVLTVKPRRMPWYRWFKQDVLILEDLKKDRVALRHAYQRLGYATAEIGPAVLEKPPGLDGFRLTWPIMQVGPVFTIGYVGLDVDVTIQHDVLAQIMTLRSGERFNPDRIRLDRHNLQSFFYREGHAFVSVEVESERVKNENRVDLVFNVTAGSRPRLRNQRITGNTKTHRRIIEREIDVRPGTTFCPDALQRAQNQLSLLPMFSEVDVLIDGAPDADLYDLRVEVNERKTGRIEIGAMYGETERVVGELNVSEKNLSLSPPFRGEALQARLGVKGGPRILSGNLGLRNPRVGDSQWSLDGSFFFEDNSYISEYYDQRTIGGQLLAGHPLGAIQTVHLGYAASMYSLKNISEQFADDPRLMDDFFLTALLLSWDLDQTDRLMRPTRGVRLRSGLRLGSRALGGDTETIQTHAEAAFFYSPGWRHVISLRGGMRSVEAYGKSDTVPASLRLYLGGVNDLRGFAYRSISPQDDEDRLIGGLSAWWSTLEYLLPVSPRLDLAVYLDAGDVSSEASRFEGDGPVSNWGVGLLVRADNFPVRFDLAYPIDTYDYDLTNQAGKSRLSFSAGFRYY